MHSTATQQPRRRLVLGRETVCALTEARPPRAITLQPQEMTSCTPDCGGSCGLQVY